jgi:hypothetical protein
MGLAWFANILPRIRKKSRPRRLLDTDHTDFQESGLRKIKEIIEFNYAVEIGVNPGLDSRRENFKSRKIISR